MDLYIKTPETDWATLKGESPNAEDLATLEKTYKLMSDEINDEFVLEEIEAISIGDYILATMFYKIGKDTLKKVFEESRVFIDLTELN